MPLFNLGTTGQDGKDGFDNRQGFTILNQLLVFSGSPVPVPAVVPVNLSADGWAFQGDLSAAGDVSGVDISGEGDLSIVGTSTLEGIATLEAGALVDATDPVVGNDANFRRTISVKTTFTADDINPGFPTMSGLYSNMVAINADYVYSDGSATQSKTTINAASFSFLSHASGQSFIYGASMSKYGMGDMAVTSPKMQYAGGPIAGDEGIGFWLDSWLMQQPFKTLVDLISIQQTYGGVETTITADAVTPSKDPQNIPVVSTTGMAVGDWLIWDQPVTVAGQGNEEASQIIAINSSTSLNLIYRARHLNGAVLRKATVLTVDGSFIGQGRHLVNLSRPSYSTGTVNQVSGGSFNFVGSGTTWTPGVVNGNAINIGVIALGIDDYSGPPFDGTGEHSTVKAYYNIIRINSTTSLDVESFSTIGSQYYTGNGLNGSSSYVIRPALRVVRIVDFTGAGPAKLVCEATTVNWQVGDNLEQAICPYSDVSGFLIKVMKYLPGGNNRYIFDVNNDGAQPFAGAFRASADNFHGSGPGWLAGLETSGCRDGVHIISSARSAIRIEDVGQTTSAITWPGGFIQSNPNTKGMRLCPVEDPHGNGLDSFTGFDRSLTGFGQGACLYTGMLGTNTILDPSVGVSGIFFFAFGTDVNSADGLGIGLAITPKHSLVQSVYYPGNGIDYTWTTAGQVPFFVSEGYIGQGVLGTATNIANYSSYPLLQYGSQWNGSSARLYYGATQVYAEDGANSKIHWPIIINQNLSGTDFLYYPLDVDQNGKLRFGLYRTLPTAVDHSLTLDPTATTAARTRTMADVSGQEVVDIGAHTPSSSTDTGVKGSLCRDSSFMYYCIATNSWIRWSINGSF